MEDTLEAGIAYLHLDNDIDEETVIGPAVPETPLDVAMKREGSGHGLVGFNVWRLVYI